MISGLSAPPCCVDGAVSTSKSLCSSGSMGDSSLKGAREPAAPPGGGEPALPLRRAGLEEPRDDALAFSLVLFFSLAFAAFLFLFQ